MHKNATHAISQTAKRVRRTLEAEEKRDWDVKLLDLDLRKSLRKWYSGEEEEKSGGEESDKRNCLFRAPSLWFPSRKETSESINF